MVKKLGEQLFVSTYLLMNSIFELLHFVKMCPILVSSALLHLKNIEISYKPINPPNFLYPISQCARYVGEVLTK